MGKTVSKFAEQQGNRADPEIPATCLCIDGQQSIGGGQALSVGHRRSFPDGSRARQHDAKSNAAGRCFDLRRVVN